MKKMLAAIVIGAASAAPLAAAVSHTVVDKDHLWGLADHYYHDHYRWRVIATANAGTVKDPHWIYPGQILIIPDLAAPEVPAKPAEPVAASAPVAAPQPPAPKQPAAEEPEAAEPAPEPMPDKPDDLSVKLPPSLAGQYPSMTREQPPKGWTEDGSITEYEGREAMAAQGDLVSGRMSGKASASIGEKFVVYRRATAQELDDDQKALYLQKVGLVEVKQDLGKGRYRFLILKSGDSVQVGDLLKKQP